MNKSQQIIIAIVIPLVLIIGGYGYITSNVTIEESKQEWESVGFENGQYNSSKTLKQKLIDKPVEWNDFENTWKIWLTLLIITGALEITLFSMKLKK